MIIMTQNRKCVINAQYVQKAYSSSNNVVRLEFDAGRGEEAGRYDNADQTQRAIGMMFNAWADGKDFFEFPTPQDLPEIAKQHRGSASVRRVSHGGS